MFSHEQRRQEILHTRTSALALAGGLDWLWKASGRSRLSFEEMVLLNIKYIRKWSLAKDAAILLRTVRPMLLGEGL